ncbi:hypothetical protein AAVH_06662 [Aphelenchoides avenae]|nr:hypothetical protein AAVH_06662 [Aphelenchus avenae]
MQLVLAVPITYTAKNLYGTGALIYSLTVVDTLSYYGTLLFAFLMALNRTMTFFLAKVNKRMFDVPNIYGTIAITWLFVTITPISLYASGCFKIFDVSAVYLQVFCQSSAVTFAIRKVKFHISSCLLGDFWNYVKQGIPVAVLIMYLAIFFYVYYSTRKALAATKSNGKAGGGIKSKERSIILQSFLIVGVLEARDWILHGLPLIIQDSRGTIYLNVAHECSYILSSSLTAIVVLTWNKEIRARWISLLCCRSLHARIGPSILVNSTFSLPSGASRQR